MSSIEAQNANIKTIDTNVLNINQSVTSVKWNPSKKHTDINLLNSTQTAKLDSRSAGFKGILGNTAYTIGVSVDTLKFDIHRGSELYFGLAVDDKDLTSVDTDTKGIAQLFTVSANTILTMSLTRKLVSTSPDVYESKLTYIYEGKTTEIDITPYTGSVMYPWLADNNSTGFSVDISKTTVLKTYIDTNGDVVFSTVDSSGVSRPMRFETGSNDATFDNLGFSGLPSITYDIVETSTAAENGVTSFNMELRVQHPSSPGLSNPGVLISEGAKITSNGIDTSFVESSSGSLILRETGGADVTIDSAGAITTPSSIEALNLTSNLLQASGVPGLQLLENSGNGILIEDGTGDVVMSGRLSVGDGGDLTSDSVVASFATTSLDQALVIPTVQNVTVGTIPALQQVTGMIVYSIDDNKFMGFKSGGWVDLSV